MIRRTVTVLTLFALPVGSVSGLIAVAPQPDAVFYNAKIVTLNAANHIAEALAVGDGRFIAVGSNKEILAIVGARTEKHDLGGRTVIPGLADNHYHTIGGGPGVDLSRARSLRQVLQAISERASRTEPGQLIITNGDWHEGQLGEKRLPLRDDLDRAAPNHPVVVVRGGHQLILNTAALRRWKIDESIPEPEGGRLGRYRDGRLNGELVDHAKDLVSLPQPQPLGFEQQLDALEDEFRKLNAAGLTTIRYAGAPPSLYRAIQELNKRGRLSIRVNFLFRLAPTAHPDELDRVIAGWGAEPSGGDHWVRVGGVKLGVDGGFEGGLMREPYAEPWGEQGTYRGLQTVPTETYRAVVAELNRRGWRVATHAVGDAAIDLVLDAYQRANAQIPIQGRRWVIEHGFIPRPDHFRRIRELGLVVSVQNHLYVAAPSLIKYWGPARARWVTPVKAYLTQQIPISSGTDSPVIPYNPFWTIYHFVTRQTLSAGVMGADQRVSRLEALRVATVGNAFLTFEEGNKGSIEPGKLADFVVLAQDILTCPHREIERMKVMMTVVGGRVVFEALGEGSHRGLRRRGDRGRN